MSETSLRSNLTEGLDSRRLVAGVAALLLVAIGVLGVLFPSSDAGQVLNILTAKSTLSATLRLSVPIAFAALGGIFAEKSGVINIGLEGLLIISAFGGVYFADVTGSTWLGLLAGVLASTLLALLFAVVCIEFRADQIIAGLAIWLIALGLAPFASQVVYGGPNTASVPTIGTVTIPYLSDIPSLGALFDATPFVYMMFVAVALSWWTLNRTTFGRWVIASGENPKALDTAGVDVQRVRYAAVVISGVLAGIGGAALSLSLGQFTGNGPTMVNGKGFIAIVAYLFGNYNPIGAMLSTMLFAGLDALQLTLQARDVFAIPQPLVRTIPYVTVIVVLALVGRTQIPEAAGDHYESGDD
ncbi:simple sugar transport system permease protein [Halopelagius inordinatus]|uniref:Simple sugar transport system permease protein n=1 Tax=Halopelagius inordinatus TaxID=553467 RepID=A0A1I2PBT1_9EURY|nr:ABC transporter permease [Halopelagius inordinatus]SFG13585.1 simple sugar transport system permease protein [Halopelagius inordinatus]